MKRTHVILGLLLTLALLSGTSRGLLGVVSPDAVKASTVEEAVVPLKQSILIQAGQNVERCATIDDAPAALKRRPDQVELPFYQMRAAALAAGSAIPRTVQVAFHVIQGSSGAGDVTDAQIARQIAVMNNAYHNTGFRFELVSVDRTVNDKWVNVKMGTGEVRKIKETLAIDPAHTLNIYTAALSNGILGWSTFPWAYMEASWENAVFVHYESLPGGTFIPYNEGETATHEVGHYLGLYHTFQGGCTEPGDYVADTPAEAFPAFGCPIGRDTCPAAGLDPVTNFMDYSDDSCVTEFTPDQSARMIWAVDTYRPSLAQ